MANDLLFRRLVKLTVANRVAEDYRTLTSDVTEIEKLRVAFKVTKTGGKEPNTCEVTVSNLAESRRKALQKKGVKLVLQAGYEGAGIAQLFIGDVRTVDNVRDGATWNTIFKCGDGERAFRFARVSESFGPGTKIPDVVKKVAARLGVGLGNLEKQAPAMTGEFAQGYAAHGPASRELERALAAAGFEFSIQDEQLLVLKPGDASGVQVPELSPASGLIGSPEFGSPETIHAQTKKTGKPLIKVRALLNGKIKIGSQVVLRCARHDGPVIVKKLEHIGDTAGGDWYTNFEAVLT